MAYSPREKRSLDAVCADCWSHAVGSAQADDPAAGGFGNGGARVGALATLVTLVLPVFV